MPALIAAAASIRRRFAERRAASASGVGPRAESRRPTPRPWACGCAIGPSLKLRWGARSRGRRRSAAQCFLACPGGSAPGLLANPGDVPPGLLAWPGGVPLVGGGGEELVPLPVDGGDGVVFLAWPGGRPPGLLASPGGEVSSAGGGGDGGGSVGVGPGSVPPPESEGGVPVPPGDVSRVPGRPPWPPGEDWPPWP